MSASISIAWFLNSDSALAGSPLLDTGNEQKQDLDKVESEINQRK